MVLCVSLAVKPTLTVVKTLIVSKVNALTRVLVRTVAAPLQLNAVYPITELYAFVHRVYKATPLLSVSVLSVHKMVTVSLTSNARKDLVSIPVLYRMLVV